MAEKIIFVLVAVQILSAVTAQNFSTHVPNGFYLDAEITKKATKLQLSCTNVSSDLPDYNEKATSKWIYRVSDLSTETVSLFPTLTEGSCKSDQCTLTEDVYYSGCYRCEFTFTSAKDGSTVEVYADFNVTETSGSQMNGTCAKDADCMTLNAKCDSKICTCPVDYNILFSNGTDNPACLEQENLFGDCNLDSQCYKENQCLVCSNQKCLCSTAGHIIDVDGTQQCLETVYPWGQCLCDENCYTQQSGPTATCKDGICQCNANATIKANLKSCEETEMTIITQSCSAANYSGGASCSLCCSVDPPSPDYTLISSKWTYMAVPGASNNYTIPEGKPSDPFTTTLPLSTYNSGEYVCQFVFTDDVDDWIEVNAAFKISDVKGVLINEQCSSATDCTTLNAKCDSHVTQSDVTTCNCNGDFPVQYNIDPDAPVCLPYVAEGGSCIVEQQCLKANEVYSCLNNTCQCVGTKTKVDNKQMCLASARLFAPCFSTAQCVLSDPKTACVNYLCACADGYEYSDSSFTCEETLSGGAIAGIVIGTLVGVVVIVVALVMCIFKRK